LSWERERKSHVSRVHFPFLRSLFTQDIEREIARCMDALHLTRTEFVALDVAAGTCRVEVYRHAA
jgi:hypothetical protein